MRLHPHTGRPCLGLFHLHRRMKHLDDLFHRPTLWHQDALNQTPLRAAVPSAVQLCYLSHRVVQATVRATSHHIDVNLVLPGMPIMYSPTGGV